MVAHSLLLTVALGSLLAASHATASAAPAPRWPVRAAPSCEWAGFDDAVARFSRIIQFKTVSDPSSPNHAVDTAEFQALGKWLETAYPEVWAQLEVEQVGVDGLSRLITWRGSEPALRPALFISHIDVVPVTPGSEANWTHPPFSGAVADGFLWGRGSMDVKVTVVTLLEAASSLLAAGWSPRRTLMFGFGQDEEVGGGCGAAKTAELLAARGVELEIIWDEGTSIMVDGLRPFVSRPVALVATAEKGYQSVRVDLASDGGHSSMPAIDGSTMGDMLGRLLSKLSGAPPAPKLVPPVTDMLRGAAPYAPAWLSVIIRTMGVLPGGDLLLARIMAAASGEAAALTRTTAAVTGVAAGVADNVLPQRGSVNVNFRLLPGDTLGDALAYLRRVIGDRDMARAKLEPHGSNQPASKVTPADGTWFRLLKQAIQESWYAGDEPVPVLPFLMPGMTDSHHYARLSAHGALRFIPNAYSRARDVRRVHGTDERMRMSHLRAALCTTRRALQLFGSQAGGGGGGTDSSAYANLTAGGALRFQPRATSDADLRRVHGTDERAPLDGFRTGLCTTRRALQLFGEHAGGTPGPGAGGTDSSSPAGGKLRREAPASVV